MTNTPRQTVTDIVENAEKRQLSDFGKTFEPLLYAVWNAAKQDNARAHFGAFPEQFMENLLYYHTEPLDVVYDPFGGGGTTVDVCKRMFRRAFALLSLRAGVDLVSLQRLMGHSGLEVLRRYLAQTEGDLKAAHAKGGPVDHNC